MVSSETHSESLWKSTWNHINVWPVDLLAFVFWSLCHDLDALQVADGEIEAMEGKPVDESFQLSREEFKVQPICCIGCQV